MSWLLDVNFKDTTDAHLVRLAARHHLKLATLDMALVSKSWAAGIAENPLVIQPRNQ